MNTTETVLPQHIVRLLPWLTARGTQVSRYTHPQATGNRVLEADGNAQTINTTLPVQASSIETDASNILAPNVQPSDQHRDYIRLGSPLVHITDKRPI